MELDYSLLGSKIRTLRKKQGLTQEKFAELCDVSASFVGHIERGTRKMSLETFERICRVLQCSADDLLGLRGVLQEEVSFIIDQLITELQKRRKKETNLL